MATLDKLTTILDFKTDLSSLRRAESAVNRTRGQLDNLAPAATRAGRGLDQVGSAGRRGAAALGSLPAILGAVGAGLVLNRLKDYADTWTLIGNRVKLYTGSAEETTQVQHRLFQISQNTRSSLEATATLYQRVAMANDSLGVSQDRLLGFTETLNQAFIVSGASAQEARNAVIQFSQGLASGELRGEEFRSVTEQGTRVIQALAQSLGVTRGELREMAHTGQLTSDVVFKAIEQDAGNIRQEFEKLTPTIGQSFTVLGNSLTAAVGQFSEATGAANFFAQAITGIAGAIDAVTTSGRRQDQQLTAAQRRRQNRQRQDVGGVPVVGQARGAPPPGLNAAQRRQWYRGQIQQTPSGFAAALGVGFDASEAGVPTPFRLPDVRPEDATLANIKREFEQEFADLFNLPQIADQLGSSLGAIGFAAGGTTEKLRGLAVLQAQYNKRLKAQADEIDDSLSDGATSLGAIGFAAGGTTEKLRGLAVLQAQYERRIASQKRAIHDVSLSLIQSVANTDKFAGALFSIVQGAQGGPIGLASAGINALVGGLLNVNRAAKDTTFSMQTLAEQTRQREETTARTAFEIRQQADPEGVAQDLQNLFSRFAPIVRPENFAGLGDFLQSPALTGILDTLGQIDQYEARLAGIRSTAGLSASEIARRESAALELLPQDARQVRTLLTGLQQAFGGSFVEFGQQFFESDAFLRLFGMQAGGDLGAPLPVGPVPASAAQQTADAFAAAGVQPIEVVIQQMTIEVSGAGDPSAVVDEFDRKFRAQLRGVAEAVDTQIKA